MMKTVTASSEPKNKKQKGTKVKKSLVVCFLNTQPVVFLLTVAVFVEIKPMWTTCFFEF